MNKQKPGGIGWCDYTWGAVTGCWGPGGTAEKPNRCSYCYAVRVAQRFHAREVLVEPGDPFAPRFHPDRLNQPAKVKKPSRIFVCSMADLFGDWVPHGWIEDILGRCTWPGYSHHTFQFLTKNPKRLKDFNPWPENCWVGTTVTNQADADERLPWLLQVEAPVLFVSHEPLLWEISVRRFFSHSIHCIKAHPGGSECRCKSPNWAIIGAQTGPGAVKVDPAWVVNLEYQYQAAGVPIFEKNNLSYLCGLGAKLVQEFPK